MDFARVPGNPEPAGAEFLWLEGSNGASMRCMIAPAHGTARGSVILCGGRTEFIEKYFEVARELQARGFVVFTLDWRGQGLSARDLPNSQKGHFDSFDDPVNDLALVLRQANDRLPQPHILIAHSMGGAITLRALQTRRLEVSGALFNAPMWGVPGMTPPVKAFARFMTGLGMGARFAPGVQQRWRREDFRRNVVTHDQERHARIQGLIAADPRLALAGPTIGWLAAAAQAMATFQTPDALSNIRIPITILSAEQEALVDNAAHAALAERFPNAKHIVVPGARHEIMMEKEPARAQFWKAFDDLAAEVAAARAVPAG